jgi:protein disulfide-isomerase-like protein
VNVGKVDCTVEKQLCERFKVRGYPSLRFVKDAQMYPYRGAERTAAALSAFATADYATLSAPSKFTTAADFAAEAAAAAAQPPPPSPPAAPATQPAAAAAADKGAADAARIAAAARDGVAVKVSLLWDAPGAPGPAGRWDGAHGPSDLVRTLSDSNFDQKTSTGTWLLQLCAPNVRACEIYRATTDRLATTVKQESANVAAVDCTLERPLCDRLQVVQFPTILLVNGGKMHPYTGDRSHDKLTQFVYSQYRQVASVPVPPRGTEAPAAAKQAYIDAIPQQMSEQAAAATTGQATNLAEAAAAAAASAAALPTVSVGGVEMEGDVVLLTEANAPGLLSSGVWFVEIYAPWCGHCKTFAPTWAEFASQLKKAGSPVRIAKFDGTVHTALADKLKVAGFPTLRFLKENVMYEWRGAKRTPDLLQSYIDSRYTQTPSYPSPFIGYVPPAAAAPVSVSQTTDRAKPARVSPLWDASDAPGAKGRWDGSPTSSALVRDVTAANWNVRSKASSLLHLCDLAEKQCAFYRPTLERVASTLLSHSVDVIAIDCAVERVLCIKLGVSNMPDVRMLANNQMYSYNDVRNHDKLVEFATSGFRAGKAIAIPQLDKAALAEDAAAAAGIARPDAAAVEPASAPAAAPVVVAAPPATAAPAAAGEVKATTQTWPGVTVLTLTNFALTTAYGDWLVAFVRSGEAESEAFSALMSVFAAKKTLGTVSLSVIDCATESVLCGAFGVRATPRVAIFSTNKYFKHDGALTTAAITEFAEWRWRGMHGANLGDSPNELAIWARIDVIVAIVFAMLVGFAGARCVGGSSARQQPAASNVANNNATANNNSNNNNNNTNNNNNNDNNKNQKKHGGHR